jgi:hypothetical protein
MEAQIQKFLQKTEISFSVNNNNSMHHVAPELVTIPAVIPTGTVVAVLASKKSGEKYWLAEVTNVYDRTPPKYDLHFYRFDKAKKSWIKMRGNGAYGSCKHESIIMAGLHFVSSGSLSEHSKKQLAIALQKF